MTDLTDRLRTCAAYVLGRAKAEDPWAVEFVAHDTADLLIEASNVLEKVPEPLGEPMAIIEPKPLPTGDERKAAREAAIKTLTGVPKAVWTTNAGDLPPVPTGQPSKRPPRVCPECDSRANKRVFRQDNKVMLACPVCAFAWEYQP